jgi:hypothetical protein
MIGVVMHLRSDRRIRQMVQVKAGMSESEVTQLLGEPSKSRPALAGSCREAGGVKEDLYVLQSRRAPMGLGSTRRGVVCLNAAGVVVSVAYEMSDR